MNFLRQFLKIVAKWYCGDAGHRSPYLSHAKRALYHLSYIPLNSSSWLTVRKWCSCSVTFLIGVLKYIFLMQLSSKTRNKRRFWRCGASIPVPLACEASALPFELHPLECVCFVIMKQPSFCCVFIWCLLRHLLDTAFGVNFVAKVDCGDAGHRSPYLSHAKRALYHLSYIPLKEWMCFIVLLQPIFCCVFSFCL